MLADINCSQGYSHHIECEHDWVRTCLKCRYRELSIFNIDMNNTKCNHAPQPGRDGRLPGLFTVNTNGIDDAGVDRVLNMTGLSSWKTATQNVNLSLSKKGRWKIIEALKEEMENNVYNEEEFNLYVIERLWMNGAANCESITGSKGCEKTFQGGSCFFNADSFLRKPKEKTNGKRKKTTGPKIVPPPTSESDTPPDKPEIRIEVVQPHGRCRTSSATVTSRRRRRRAEYTNVTPVPASTYWSDWGAPDVSQVAAKPEKKSEDNAISGMKRRPVLSWDSDDGDVEEQPSFDVQDDETDEHPKFIKDVMFEDLFVKKAPCFRRKRTRNPTNLPSGTNKGKIRYIDKDEFALKGGEVSGTDGTTEVIDEMDKVMPEEGGVSVVPEADGVNIVPEKDSVTVVFKPDDVAPEALTAIFGERYLECACHPRRFLLDMTGAFREVPHFILSQRVHHRMRRKRKKYFTAFVRKACSVTTAGFLLFEEQCDGKFSFLMESDADLNKSLWMKAAEVTEEWSPLTLVNCMCDLIKEHTSTSTKLKDHKPPDPNFPTLKKLLSWPKSESYLPSAFPAVKSRAIQIQVSKVTDIPDCCSVCYDVIDMSSRDTRGMALTECGHWFCHTCWKGHVKASLESGSVHTTCPEFGCKSRLDVGTLASLMSMSQMKLYMSRLDDMEISTSESKSWCPRPGCSRIVSLLEGGADTGCAQCGCGATFCVQCRGHPHWPAECSNMARYVTDLKHFGDDKMLSWSPGPQVKGKRCPKCKHFIQKNGGCPNMVCTCGFSFCWQCFQPWDDHNNSGCYSKKDDEDSKLMREAYFESISEHPESRSRAYMLALSSRQKQGVSRRHDMTHHVTKMKRKLKGLVFKHQRSQSEPSRNQPGRKSRDLVELHQILENTDLRGELHLLDWALNLILEVHHVVEYTAVLFDQTSCSPRLYQMVSSLRFLVSRMEQVFQDGMDQKVAQVPIKLTRLGNMVMERLTDLRAGKLYCPLKVMEQEVTS
ncbi:uncharacterized protein LOC124282097 [Haliotis rubra]|uniref:uncharacterized protein LOC124282097 n=1 Tax=Haliotis rubra TaxID=36100 RepID=UPI001EE62627|nr:uncharacterized protein LOC124282097 [Haliotis rubra]